MGALRDLTASRFGRLIAIKRVGTVQRRAAWLCRCDCGETVVTASSNLTTGSTRSCGCLQRELARKNGALSDGSANVKHGGSQLPEYFIWKTMRQRATGKGPKKDRERYAGITCCARWADFACFIGDMGLRPSPAHSLDRIDNNGNYEPGNVRWATPVEQNANRRPRRPARVVHAARAAFNEGA